jgi:hypothetical protein
MKKSPVIMLMLASLALSTSCTEEKVIYKERDPKAAISSNAIDTKKSREFARAAKYGRNQKAIDLANEGNIAVNTEYDGRTALEWSLRNKNFDLANELITEYSASIYLAKVKFLNDANNQYDGHGFYYDYQRLPNNIQDAIRVDLEKTANLILKYIDNESRAGLTLAGADESEYSELLSLF